MLLKELHGKWEYPNKRIPFVMKGDLEGVEFSKRGLSQFHEKTNTYILVILSDGETSVTFDKNGTFPTQSEDQGFIRLDSTGSFHPNKRRNVPLDKIIQVYADVGNVFDAINYFEAGKDMKFVISEADEDEEG